MKKDNVSKILLELEESNNPEEIVSRLRARSDGSLYAVFYHEKVFFLLNDKEWEEAGMLDSYSPEQAQNISRQLEKESPQNQKRFFEFLGTHYTRLPLRSIFLSIASSNLVGELLLPNRFPNTLRGHIENAFPNISVGWSSSEDAKTIVLALHGSLDVDILDQQSLLSILSQEKFLTNYEEQIRATLASRKDYLKAAWEAALDKESFFQILTPSQKLYVLMLEYPQPEIQEVIKKISFADLVDVDSLRDAKKLLHHRSLLITNLPYHQLLKKTKLSTESLDDLLSMVMMRAGLDKNRAIELLSSFFDAMTFIYADFQEKFIMRQEYDFLVWFADLFVVARNYGIQRFFELILKASSQSKINSPDDLFKLIRSKYGSITVKSLWRLEDDLSRGSLVLRQKNPA